MDAIQSGADGDKLLAVGKKEFAQVSDKLQFHLSVFVYDRKECKEQDVVKINGIDFVMPASLSEALSGLYLDYGPEGFVFRGDDGLVRDPFSI